MSLLLLLMHCCVGNISTDTVVVENEENEVVNTEEDTSLVDLAPEDEDKVTCTC